MELNAEQIKKALEKFGKDEPYACPYCPSCPALNYSIKVIEELTEKNAIQVITAIELDKQVQRLTEELTKKETEYNELYELTEENKWQEDTIVNLSAENVMLLSEKKKLIEENERLKKPRHILMPDGIGGVKIETIPSADQIRADTVRKMSKMLKDYLDDYYHSGEDALLDVPDMIDLIAKEMLEGNNEEG